MENIENYIIQHSVNISNAIKKMDKGGIGFIAIANNDDIIGIVTDGDFRRSILDGISLKENVKRIMNKDFIYLNQQYKQADVKKIFSESCANHLPVLQERKLIDIITFENFNINKNNKKRKKLYNPVVIMAGGMGTRLYPFTRILPKPLIPLGNDPIIKVIMDSFAIFGMEKFLVSLNHKGKMIKAYFYDHEFDYNIKFFEEVKPLGTAGSLKLMHKSINETFFVSNCDIIIKSDYDKILEFHQIRQNAITLVGSVRHHTVPYGVCEIENGGDLTKIIEKPEYDYLTNTGLYVMEPEVINLIPENHRFDMTDLIAKAQESELRVGVFPVSDKSWIDIGQIKDYNLAISDYEKYLG